MNQKHIDYLRGLYYENDGNINAVCDAVGLDCDGRLQGVADELFRIGVAESLRGIERYKYYMIEYFGKQLEGTCVNIGNGGIVYDIYDKLPDEKDCMFADIETTGLPVISNGTAINDGRQPGIIEWACYMPGNRYEWDVTLVEPSKPIPKEIQGVTGITNEMVFVNDYSIITPFQYVISESYHDRNYFVFWNADFDANIINMNMKRIVIPADKAFCLMKYVTEHYPDIPRRHAGEDKYVRLIDAYNYFYPDKPMEQKHRAKADVELMYAVYRAVKEK